MCQRDNNPTKEHQQPKATNGSSMQGEPPAHRGVFQPAQSKMCTSSVIKLYSNLECKYSGL